MNVFIKNFLTKKVERIIKDQLNTIVLCRFNQITNAYSVEFDGQVFTNSDLQICIKILDAYFMSVAKIENKMVAFFCPKS